MSSFQLSTVALEFNASAERGCAAEMAKSDADLRVLRATFAPVVDDSEKLLAPWCARLSDRPGERVVKTRASDGVAGLCAARDEIRRLRCEFPALPLAVELGGGVYHFDSPLELGVADSGTAANPVIWRAAPGESVRFSGTVPIRGFAPVDDPAAAARLNPAARGRVLVSDLAANGVAELPPLPPRGMGLAAYPVAPWNDCFFNSARLTLARYPKKHQPQLHTGRVLRGGALKPGVVPGLHGAAPSGPTEFEFRDPATARWSGADDLRADGQWNFLWASEARRVTRIDSERGTVELSAPHRYLCCAGFPFFFFNLLEELTEPGEWYCDRRAGKIYCIPPADAPSDPADVCLELSRLDRAFVLAEGVEHLAFRNFEVFGGAADGMFWNRCGDVLLDRMDLHGVSGNGMIVRNGRGVGLVNCRLHHIGATALLLGGGDRATLTRGENFAVNTVLAFPGEVDRSYGCAASLTGCGNSLLHIDMHDIPHNGIMVGGDLQTIAYVDGHDLVRDFDDLAGIDTGFDPYVYGNRYFYNFWHDVGSLAENTCGQCGIRIDDMTNNLLIYGNIFLRCAQGSFGGVQIHAGKNNIVENNLFIDCARALSITTWDDATWSRALENKISPEKQREGTAPYRLATAPHLARLDGDHTRNFLVNNWLIDCGGTVLQQGNAPAYQHLAGNLAVTVRGDYGALGFRDPDGGDWRLADDSVLYRELPFAPIPFERIGIVPDLQL